MLAPPHRSPAVGALEGDVGPCGVVLEAPGHKLPPPLAFYVGALVMLLLVDRTDQGVDVDSVARRRRRQPATLRVDS
eukprot:3784382-Pleurochrysis_carterae.AAC.1